MGNNNCENCKEMQRLVDEYKIDLEKIQELIDNNILELYGANCYPKEISYYMDRGNHYIIQGYYRCNRCNRYFYLGFCLYGNPILKEVSEEEAKRRSLLLEWGFVGSYFNK